MTSAPCRPGSWLGPQLSVDFGNRLCENITFWVSKATENRQELANVNVKIKTLGLRSKLPHFQGQGRSTCYVTSHRAGQLYRPVQARSLQPVSPQS